MTPFGKEPKNTDANVQGQNRINGNFGKISKEQTLRRSYGPLQPMGKRGLNVT